MILSFLYLYLNAKDINTIVKALRITNANTNAVFECIVLGFIKIYTV